MKPSPIAPRSPVMVALDILEGRIKVKPASKEKAAQRKPAVKKNERAKGKA